MKGFNGKLYYWASVNGQYQLWCYDLANPPVRIGNISAGENSYFEVFNNRLFFFVDAEPGAPQLWSYDGVNPPTQHSLQQGVVFNDFMSAGPFLQYEGKLYFGLSDGWKAELWSCDNANNASFEIALPDDESLSHRIRSLYNLNGSLYFTTENALWKYTRSPFSVLSPNGKEYLEGGSNFTITWTAPESITHVNIELSTDNGMSWTTLAASVPNSGAYPVVWPDVNAEGQCLVKISDANSPSVDISNATFTIIRPSKVTITYPNGGEVLGNYGYIQVQWDYSNLSPYDTVIVEYSLDGGNTWNQNGLPPSPITLSQKSVECFIDNVTASSSCLIRIRETSGQYADSSDAPFTISSQIAITLDFPKGGEYLCAGHTRDINWRSPGLSAEDMVFLEYSLDGGTTWKSDGFPENPVSHTAGMSSWQIPLAHSNTCLFRVRETTGKASGTSNSYFTIDDPKYLTITNPTYKDTWNTMPHIPDVWLEGRSKEITWTWVGPITRVRLEYSNDPSGEIWNVIAPSAPNTGSFTWIVPVLPTNSPNECWIRVIDIDNLELQEYARVNILGPEDKISLAERNALIALYNATLGDNWIHKENWRNPQNPQEFNEHGTESLWYGLTIEMGGQFDRVYQIKLPNNNLNGPLTDLSAMTSLSQLSLQDNGLTGNVASLTENANLAYINLSNNKLSGPIPDFVKKNTIRTLNLNSNRLCGPIPDSYLNMTKLSNDGGFQVSWNALYTQNTALRDFLNMRDLPSNPWDSTQTVAPDGLTIPVTSSTNLQLTWSIAPYNDAYGGYEIYRSTTPGSNYQLISTVDGKRNTSYTDYDLTPGTIYYYRIKTFTHPNPNNWNRVLSEYCSEVSGNIKAISITAPNGGETLTVGAATNITWNYSSAIAHVKIEYSTNGVHHGR